MPLITIKDIYKSFGTDHLFCEMSLKIFRKEKVGLIGANGTGKTTLFKMILGNETPDAGEIEQRKNTTVGYLPQEPIFSGEKTVMQEMHESLSHVLDLQKKVEKAAENLADLSGGELETAMHEYDLLHQKFELAGGYHYETMIKTTLAGVGITEEHYDTLTSKLSGGQLSRLGLAKVLTSGCDLLLLDEPTNHLDLGAIEWLERFLRNYDGAAVIISHDRYLLDNLAMKIFEIEHQKATVWKGNYSNYLEQKELYLQQRENELAKKQQFLKKEIDFIERNKNDVGMSKVARGRATRLNKMLDDNPNFLEKVTKHRTLNFRFEKIENLSHNVLKCSGLSKKYGDLLLFENLDMELLQGQRLMITGPNGTGKSTLLKIALGLETPTTGKARFGSSLRIGYMDQQGLELIQENTVLQEIQRIRPDMLHGEIRNKLGAFLFHGDDVFKKVENLSGGEQNRLLLCRLVLTKPDVLVLDEPTNHLDIQSKEALEIALREYQGTIIAVSHDRYFINKVADKMLIIGSNKLGKKEMGIFEFFAGDGELYTLYAEQIRKNVEAAQQEKFALSAKNSSGNTKNAGNNAKPKRQAPPEIKHLNKYRVEQVEEMIMETEENIADLKSKFGLEEYYTDHEKLAQLQNEVAGLEKELDLLYMAYEYKSS